MPKVWTVICKFGFKLALLVANSETKNGHVYSSVDFKSTQTDCLDWAMGIKHLYTCEHQCAW